MAAPQPPKHLTELQRELWAGVLRDLGMGADSVSPGQLEAYVGQLATLREAQSRVDREGMVIAGPKGDPMAHPAIAVARAAQAELRAWGSRFDPQAY